MNHNRSAALERSVNITWGLKPVLRVPNLALSFYHGSKHTAGVYNADEFSLYNLKFRINRRAVSAIPLVVF